MSGLFLKVATESLSTEDKKFPAEVAQKASRLAGDTFVPFSSDKMCGGVLHHNFLRSNGDSEDAQGNFLAVAGACWISKHDEKLATPEELLSRCQGIGFGSEPTFNGQFVFACYESQSRRLIVENDRWGVIPVHYQVVGGVLTVSTQLKCIQLQNDARPNLDCIAQTLHFGYQVTKESLIADIYRMPANHRLIFENGTVRLEALQKTVFSRSEPVNSETIGHLTELFDKSISRYYADTDTLSVSLSAGLDSRIAALSAQKSGFSLKSTSSGEPGALECRLAGEVANALDIPFKPHIIDGSKFPDWFPKSVWASEGRCPPEHIHFMSALFAGNYYKEPQLHGLVGDATIGGDFENLSLLTADADTIRSSCLKSMKGFVYWPHDSLRKTLRPEVLANTEGLVERTADELFAQMKFKGTYSDFLNFRWDFRVSGFTMPCLGSQVLPWTDLVAPYVDQALWDFCASLETSPLMDRALQISWGMKAYPGMDAYPRLKDGIVVDIDAADTMAYDRGLKRLEFKRKLRYMICRLSQGRINLPNNESYPAYSEWYRKWPKIRQYFADILLSERCLDRGLWHREGIEYLMHNMRVGRRVWPALATLLTLELFYRQFVDGVDQPASILEPSRWSD